MPLSAFTQTAGMYGQGIYTIILRFNNWLLELREFIKTIVLELARGSHARIEFGEVAEGKFLLSFPTVAMSISLLGLLSPYA